MSKPLIDTKRVAAAFAIGATLFCTTAVQANTSWVVIDAKTGQTLGEDDANMQRAPASLAKMMTVYLTFEALKTGRLHWDDEMPVSKNAAAKPRMKLWVKAGQTISVRDAVNAMIILSANDVATVVGEHIGGSELAFGRLMTRRARQLGMRSTIFVNPSGLTDTSTQLTTAHDMAVLGIALNRDFPQEYQLFSQRSFTYNGRPYNGHNNLMYRYNGVDGIKTGYTNVSGYNLVSSLNADGRHIVGVVLGAGSAGQRDGQMAKLLQRYQDHETASVEGEVSPMVTASVKKDNVSDLIDDSRVEQGDGGYLLASSSWRIQVGVSPSQKNAKHLQAKIAPVVARFDPAIRGEIAGNPKGKRAYRVLFNGFKSEQAAQAACAEVLKQNSACITLQN